MIELERRGSIAVLTLAHGKANVLDPEVCGAVAARIEECRAAWCQAVVVTARGSIFSAGVDLLRILTEGAPYVRRFLPALCEMLEAMFVFPKPLVAAVNGHAIAGGCLIACTADRRLMARGSGRIGVPELAVGVPFPPVLLEIIRFAVAQPHLAHVISSAVTADADRAVEYGFVDRAVDAESLASEAIAAAHALAAYPAEAFALIKRQLRAPAVERFRPGQQQFDAAVIDAWCAPETLDAIRGYIERTFKKGA
jgi:enoyl-CoA hydratase